jgi:hypothetical protein
MAEYKGAGTHSLTGGNMEISIIKNAAIFHSVTILLEDK